MSLGIKYWRLSHVSVVYSISKYSLLVFYRVIFLAIAKNVFTQIMSRINRLLLLISDVNYSLKLTVTFIYQIIK